MAALAEHALQVEAGVDWDHVVGLTVDEGYAGLEALSGIPGRVGAAPIQNVGAYGQEVAQTVGWVRALDRSTHDVVLLGPEECGFGYRDSVFKRSDRYVVLAVAFALEHSRLGAPVRYAELARRLGVEVGERVPATDVRAAVLELRRGKGMVLDAGDHDTWSAGSFFTNPLLPPDQARRPAGGRAAVADRRRPGQDLGRVADRAGRLSARATAPARPGCRPSTRWPSPTAAAPPPRSCWRSPARSGRPCSDRFGVTLVPEPVLVGAEL